MSKFQTFGPFKMKRNGSLVDTSKFAKFWGTIERQSPGLSRAVGCYVFAIRAGKGAKPWYVGKAEKRNLKDETWSPHKLNVYSKALNLRERGTPVFYLIAKQTRVGRYAKPRKGGIGDVRALENLLIGSCLLRNSKLLNVKQVKHPKGIVVPGYMNEPPGRPLGISKKPRETSWYLIAPGKSARWCVSHMQSPIFQASRFLAEIGPNLMTSRGFNMPQSKFLAATLVVASLPLIAPRLRAQEASYDAIADTVEVGTVGVSRSWPHAQIIEGRLATRENISLLANVKTICVLPYDGFKAKNIIEGLPSLDGIRSGLEGDKSLRQQRNDAIEQLLGQGFQEADCLSKGSTPDAELLFTKVRGGFGKTDLPAYFWLLYANEQHVISNHGEPELLGLGRPWSGELPLSIASLAEQVRSVVDAGRAATPGTGVNAIRTLSEVKAICLSAPQGITSQLTTLVQATGLQLVGCREAPSSSYDAVLEVTEVVGSWMFELTPRGGADDLYKAEARNLQAGMKDFAKALNKAKRH